jgi:hypothetical protein
MGQALMIRTVVVIREGLTITLVPTITRALTISQEWTSSVPI